MDRSSPTSEISPQAFANRPRTANPKLLHLSLDAHHHAALGDAQLHSPSISGRDIVDEGSVLWSQDETLPREQLVRPHTSNPRYTERFVGDTPRRDTSASRRETPSQQSQDTTSAPVLWASEGGDLNPAMLARPLTSNPWLLRFLDGVPDAKGGAGDGHPRSEILWSYKEIEDWRMLARPHAANPTYEASASIAATGGSPLGSARGVSEVVWSSDLQASDDADPQGTITDLRHTVHSQQNRIRHLEDEVAHLRYQLSTLSFAAAAAAASATVPAPKVPLRTAAADKPSTQAPSVASEPAKPVDITRAASVEQRRPAPAATKPQQSDDVLDITPIRRDEPHVARPPSRGNRIAATSPPRASSLVSPPGQEALPRQVAEKATTPKRSVTIEPEASIAEDEDGDDADDRLFQREAQKAKGDAKDVAQEDRSSAFVSKFRAQTTGPARPDTAAAARGKKTVTLDAPVRPMSAPAGRAGHAAAARRFCALPTSFSAIASQSATADDTIEEAYRSLCVGDSDTVSKAAFRRMYKAHAAEYGVAVSESALDRLLTPYTNAGPDHLSLREFAVLFLQLQRW
jgi:hypothetical protein